MLRENNQPSFVEIFVRKGETEVTMVSEIPDTTDELKEIAAIFQSQCEPSMLDFEYGSTIKDTPDGELTHPIVIWHAIWKHGESSKLPILSPLSLQ